MVDEERVISDHIQHLISDIDDLIYEQNKVQPFEYHYEGLKVLNKADFIDYTFSKVQLLVYTVNEVAIYPFIEYLVHISRLDSKLNFLEFPWRLDCLQHADEVLKNIMFNGDNETFTYKGWKSEGSDVLLLVYEVNTVRRNSHLHFRMNSYLFVLLDEILNHSNVVNCINIDDSVRQVFYNSIELGMLSDSVGNYVESPCVFFAGFRKQRLDFYGTFGNPPLALIESVSGCSYLFKTFQSACNDADIIANRWGDNNAGGIIRFACFLGTLDDESDEKSPTNLYDSAVRLDDENEIKVYLKEYMQHCCLTFHYLDMEGNIL